MEAGKGAVSEREQIVAWLRNTVGPETVQMMLMAGLPGGTRTQRVKNAAFAEGCADATSKIIAAIERGDHLPQPPSIEE